MLGFSLETAKQINKVNRHYLDEIMKKQQAEVRNQIKLLGPKLAESGRFWLMMDHWHNSSSSAEVADKFHGVLLGCRARNGTAKHYVLRFSAAVEKT